MSMVGRSCPLAVTVAFAGVSALVGMVGAVACQPKPPPPAAAEPVVGVAVGTSPAATPAPTRGPTKEQRRRATWRLRERGLYTTVDWRMSSAGEIDVCWDWFERKGCMSGPRQRFEDFETFLAAASSRGTDMVQELYDPEYPRMSKLFWALTVLGDFDVDYGDDDVPSPTRGSVEDLEAMIAWVASHYGLTRINEPLVLASPTDRGAIKQGDMYFGTFVAPSGEVWQCGQDAPPGKYCCYVYCESDSGGMFAEGH
jgi:hypothetical protein